MEIYSNKLKRIKILSDKSDLRLLRDSYLYTNWPVHCVGFYCLNNFIVWLDRWPSLAEKHFSCYTLEGFDRSEGLFAIVHRYQLFIGTLNENYDNLNELLMQLDWSGGFKISSFLERYHNTVANVIRAKKLQIEYDNSTLMYFMPREKALKLRLICPEGYYLKTLSIANDSNEANIINNHWPNKHIGSLFLISCLLKWNPNIGIYLKNTNELVGWCLRLQGGFLGALQVKDAYKRRGLGSVVTSAMTRLVAAQGDDVMALVNEENQASRNMFEKLGFTVTDTCYWLRTFPTRNDYIWQD